MESDVWWFDVPVNDMLEFELVLRLENMSNYRLGLFFWQDLSLVNQLLQVTIAVLKK